MKLADRFPKLGTETAFAVAAETQRIAGELPQEKARNA